jgi:hypothetical protein
MAYEGISVHKEHRVSSAAAGAWTVGFEYSMWQFEGEPAHGDVPPTTYRNPDRTNSGGIFQTDPAAGLQKWLTSVCLGGAYAGRVVLYDRLLDISGLSGTTGGSAQNINGGSAATLTRHYRDAGGQGNTDDGNELFLEIYTQIGATGTTVQAAYTDSAGASKNTVAVTLGGTSFREVQRCIRLPLDNAGAPGVQSVTSVTLAATTGTAGNFGLVVAHRLLEFEIGAQSMPELWSGVDGSFLEILPGACLAFTYETATASTATFCPMDAFLNFVDR